MNLTTFPLLALSCLAMLRPAAGQGLTPDKVGGGIPGPITTQLRNGTPNAFYVTLFALNEQPTFVAAIGLTLDIPDSFAASSLSTPGLNGFLSATGSADATFALPADPGLYGLMLSLQAIEAQSLTGPFAASNLVR